MLHVQISCFILAQQDKPKQKNTILKHKLNTLLLVASVVCCLIASALVNFFLSVILFGKTYKMKGFSIALMLKVIKYQNEIKTKQFFNISTYFLF